MELNRIRITQFRNHRASVLDFNSRVVGICGANGAGKTSVLEAIHYLTVGKGMNSASDSVYLMKGKDFFRLEGLVGNEKEQSEMHKLVVKYQSGKGKILEVNDEKVSKLGDHIGRFPVVSMTPQDMDLVLTGSKERRRIIDLAFSQIDREYLEQLLLYRRILNQRNAYLKSLNPGREFKPAMLSTFDQRMAPAADFIFQRRMNYIEELETYFSEFYKKMSDDKEKVDLKYNSELENYSFQYLAERNREKDRYSGRTNSGIHRDDLELVLYQSKLKDTASQGQLKSAVLALKLSIWELIRKHTAKDPVFLLDDLFDRLDEKRASAFLKMLKDGSNGQIFITDTHPERLRNAMERMQLPFTMYIVEDGNAIK